MEVEITPEPEKREAVLAAVEALRSSDWAPSYRSAWREAGIRENVAAHDVGGRGAVRPLVRRMRRSVS